MDLSQFHLWHYQWDAYPRVVASLSGETVGLRILVGTARDDGLQTAADDVRVEFRRRPPGRSWDEPRAVRPATIGMKLLNRLDRFDERISLARPSDVGREQARTPRPLLARPYSWTRRRLQDPSSATNRYFEAAVGRLEPGTEVEYRIIATWAPGVTTAVGWFTVVTALPTFETGDMIGGRYGSLTDAEPTWIGHVRRADGWTHVRVDIDDIPDGQCPVRVRLAGRWIDADPGAAPTELREERYRLPLVDPFAGSVTLSVPDPQPDELVFEVQGRRISEADGGGKGRTRLLFSHFCIQGINDLLESPVAAYDPPRTYMQVTMRDEEGVYSSRPRRSPGVDGYIYGLANHRRFGIPYHLALNGGVLTLMAHDTPADVEDIKLDIKNQLMIPALAGYGSHRIAYYTKDTNWLDIEYCAKVQEAILGSTGTVFSPDSRVYRRSPATRACLDNELVDFVVLDGDTGYYGSRETIRPNPNNPNVRGKDLGPHLLWHDEPTNTNLLFIDDRLKDDAVGGPDYDLGKPDIGVRRRLMRFALDPRLRDINLLTYSDDFEKFCGNGWFEGVPGLHEKARALLEWLSTHPTWLTVVTTRDLDLQDDTVGEMDVASAIDPVIDPGGARTLDANGNPLVFDSWQAQWRDYRGRWLDESIGQITDAVECALGNWPGIYQNQFYEIGWLAFLMALHEEAWNKLPLEFGDPNRARPVDPEDFTVVAGFQSRNAFVWLKASVWAQWAAGNRDGATYVNGGPVFDAIRRLPPEVSVGEWNPAHDPDRWDADNYLTMVVYNASALVVIDRDGGAVTHAFIIRNGAPVAVSGTFKSYQYKAADGVECDGPLLENTIWTPNHRYLASDLHPWSMTRTVSWDEKRPGSPDLVQRRVPTGMFDYSAAEPFANGVTVNYRPGLWPPNQVDQGQLDQLMAQDGRAARESVTTDRVIWHPPDQSYAKHFTLDGTTLRVHYEDLQVDTIIDNEVCVDLYGGLLRNELLRREPSADRRAVRIVGKAGAARIAVDGGGEITTASLLTSPDEARREGRDEEFLGLHRVLTEAVQIRATDSSLDYHVELDAQ